MIKKINDTDYEGERLIFAETTENNYTIENRNYVQIGAIERVRNGAWMHWNLVIPPHIMRECIEKEEALTFSPGCQDEIREFCKLLNGRKK